MSIAPRILLVALTTALLAGCGDDAIVGTWEAKDDSSIDLDVEEADDGYQGEGHIYVCSGDTCGLCPFDFDARETGDERWEIEGEFTEECASFGRFEDVDCELENDGDELHCEIPGAGTIEYEKQD